MFLEVKVIYRFQGQGQVFDFFAPWILAQSLQAQARRSCNSSFISPGNGLSNGVLHHDVLQGIMAQQ